MRDTGGTGTVGPDGSEVFSDLNDSMILNGKSQKGLFTVFLAPNI